MGKKHDYRVEDTETGNYCIYKGSSIQDAFEAIKDNAAIDNGEPFEDAELFDLYDGEERIWCGKTDTIEALCDICFENPIFGKKVGDYVGALYNGGGDATLIETIDEAISIFLIANQKETMTGAFDADEDTEKQLDLYGKNHDTIHFFKGLHGGCWISICFSWE